MRGSVENSVYVTETLQDVTSFKEWLSKIFDKKVHYVHIIIFTFIIKFTFI